MTAKPTPSIIHHFSSIEDPRVNRQKEAPTTRYFLYQHLRDYLWS
jgi:hypothetical protein